jgi:flagellar hook-associated protein 3 FlgL
MRIVFSTAFDDITRAMQQSAESLAEAQRQVSTGLRVSKPSDDPLSAAASVTEHAVQDRLDAYTSAGDAASYRLTLADNVMTDMVNQLTSAQSTALSARGSETPQSTRDTVANELLAIRDALTSDINTQFQGAYLFSGSKVTVAPYSVSGGIVSAYQGDTDTNAIDIGSGRSVASTFDGSAILQGGDATNVLDTLTNLAAAIQAGDQAGIDSGMQALNRAFDRANAAQARIGNDEKSLDDTRSLISSARVGSVARLSSIEDVDLAQAASKLSQANTAYRAALSAMSTIGQVSLMDYIK